MKFKILRELLLRLKSQGDIESYSIDTQYTLVGSDNQEVKIEIKVNGARITDSSMVYNPELTKASDILPFISEDIESRLMRIGLFSLLSNRVRKDSQDV